jgi:putative sterol carrier protein
MKGVHATYLFEIEGGGAWLLRIEDGVASIEEGVAEADCVITADDHDIARVLQGEQNLITGLLQGRLAIRGDMALAQRFHGALSSQLRERARSR